MNLRKRVCVAVVALAALASLPLAGQPQAERYARRPSVPGVHGLVTSGHPLASMAGMQVLLKGGNAIDASVAVLATLNVVRPQMSGAGGNGFFTIYDKASGEVYSLGATGAAPLKLDPEKVTADDLSRGILAGKVPGLFGGWVAALDHFGTMSLGELLEPAIGYAADGHPIEASVARGIRSLQDVFDKFPSSQKDVPARRPRARAGRALHHARPGRGRSASSSKPSRRRWGRASHGPTPCRRRSTASTRATSHRKWPVFTRKTKACSP